MFAAKVAGQFLRGSVEDDEKYLKLLYRARLGKPLDLDNPSTFNEKLQWLKIHDRNPLYTKLVDKAAVKPWVAERIGWEHIVPTLGVWDSFNEIDFGSLPDRFVLKCTHDSGGLAICRDRATFDMRKARERIERSLARNYYWPGREWPYKNVPPRILAEEYLDVADTADLPDYKYFCFDGKAKAMFVATERFADTETKFDFFDMDYRHLPFTNGHPNADEIPKRPDAFETMARAAEILSDGIPQVRVDFYESDGGFYFGEMTFFHWGGMMPFEPEAWDETFGSWIRLPKRTALLD